MFPKAVKFSVGAQSQYLGILCALLYTFHESNTITFSFSYTWGILIYFQVPLPLEANCRHIAGLWNYICSDYSLAERQRPSGLPVHGKRWAGCWLPAAGCLRGVAAGGHGAVWGLAAALAEAWWATWK